MTSPARTGLLPISLSPSVRMQLTICALAAVAAAPVVSWWLIAAWCIVMAACVCLEQYIAEEGLEGSAWAWARPTATSCLAIAWAAGYAIAAQRIMGSPGGNGFALALMAVVTVIILLRSYRSPVVFLLSIAPHLVVLGSVESKLTARLLDGGDYLRALTPTATIALFAVLFWGGRRQLVDSWKALEDARAEALERERVAEAANEAKSNFLATMSHEIRTPLNGVLGMAQAMTADELSGVQRERLKIIRRAGESLLAVLNDLLDLSKIEANKLELELNDFDMDHLTRGVAAAFAPLAEKKGVRFTFEIEKQAQGAYRGDTTRLRQILYNLIANAVKFTDRGQVRVCVSRTEGAVVFHVSDTGIGISKDDLARLFDNFFQADNSATRRFGGSGLGLAICRELVDLMGGDIEAFSTVGEGSSFTVTLPLQRIGDKLPAKRSAKSRTEQGSPHLRVLCAEDNDVNQLVLRTLLQQAGIEPTIVGDGREALEAWEGGEWDVILMDVQMPRLDGPATARAIRLRESELGRRRTPIIALTANAMAHQIVEYELAGMDDLVPKPIEITRLFGAIEAALGAGEDASGTATAQAS
jgi:two-component system, sensor histidine kinase